MTQEQFRAELKKSEENGYKLLFDEYCNYVYAIVFNRLRSCASRQDIDECAADVFAEVFRSFSAEGSFEGDMSGFIGTVARRRAAYFYNRLSSGRQFVSLDDEEVRELPAEADVESEVSDKETQTFLLDRIAELGEPDATIIIQKFYYNRTAKEIAKIVPLSPAAIRVRCARAIKKLKKNIEKYKGV